MALAAECVKGLTDKMVAQEFGLRFMPELLHRKRFSLLIDQTLSIVLFLSLIFTPFPLIFI
jgi:hypothetical protein